MVQLRELRLNQRNKMTEKDYNPEQRNAKAMKKQEKMKKQKIVGTEKADKKTEEKTEIKKKVEKKQVKVVKKDEAIVNGKGLPISTKYSMAICKFIKNKTIEKAMADLNEVLIFKKAVPMKGEIPHRKGRIMSGRFPINAVKEFVVLLKTLKGNSNVNGLEEPIIVEAISNKASRPYGRFGSVQRKRTHVKIIAREKKKIKKNKLKRKKK